jgi:hypothetical protein
MSARRSIRVIAAAALGAAALAPAAVDAAQPKAVPKADQLVAFRDGSAVQRQGVAVDAVTVKVGRKRCAVGASTPLAVLIRSAVGALKLKDYGSCSKRPRDAAGLYVAAIKKDRARGANGWVYKVGNKVATAGAGDPAGPFGRGKLKPAARVTWFYCRMNVRTASCQRTLGVKILSQGAGSVTVRVSSYDDGGRGKVVRGATVHAGSATATTAADGTATLQVPSGPVAVWAQAKGMVRSFQEALAEQ